MISQFIIFNNLFNILTVTPVIIELLQCCNCFQHYCILFWWILVTRDINQTCWWLHHNMNLTVTRSMNLVSRTFCIVFFLYIGMTKLKKYFSSIYKNKGLLCWQKRYNKQKPFIVGTHKKRLEEPLQMSTYTTCFHTDIRKYQYFFFFIEKSTATGTMLLDTK